MKVTDWIANDGIASFGELDAVRLACAALARVFSYPSVNEAAIYTNHESLDYLFDLIKSALLGDQELDKRYENACVAAEEPPLKRAGRMRSVFTQLFYCPNAPITLEGRYWIRRKPSDPLVRLGEEASVRQSYQAVGVRVRTDVVENACALSSELDFIALLLAREINYSCAGNGAQALLWKQRRRTFSEQHVVRFVCAVSDEIDQRSNWDILRFWSLALRKVAQRCVE